MSVGAGQMSRVYSTRLAAMKASDEKLALPGAVMASDAFLPFRDNVDVAAGFVVPFQSRGRSPPNIFLVRICFENRDVDLFSEGCQLFDRGRPLQIEGDQVWRTALFLEQSREFCRRGCLSRTIQPDDQNPVRFVKI